MSHNETDYQPNPKEKLLLEVLLNPEYRLKTITAICNKAGVERNIYYRAMEKPKFVEYYKNESKRLVDNKIAPIINTFIEQATRFGSYNHGKVLLEMAGMYSEKKKVEHSGEMTTNVNNVSMTDEELDKKIKELMDNESK